MPKRNPFEAPPVASRRGGPVKEPLSRELIVATALGLLTRDGIGGMSLRKVAAALDTGPASLYAYVDDLYELQAFVLDRALADVAIPSPHGGAWRVRLTALLDAYLRVLWGSPGLAQLAMRTIAAGPNALRIIEAMLSLLAEAGVDPGRAAWAVDLLTLYVTAVGFEQAERREQADPLGPITRVIGAVSPGAHPRVAAAHAALLAGGGRVGWAIDVLLNGIVTTPVPARAPAGDAAGPLLPA